MSQQVGICQAALIPLVLAASLTMNHAGQVKGARRLPKHSTEAAAGSTAPAAMRPKHPVPCLSTSSIPAENPFPTRTSRPPGKRSHRPLPSHHTILRHLRWADVVILQQ